MRIKSLALASAIALVGFAGSASAASTSDQFDVTLNVAAACTIGGQAADIYMEHDSTGGNAQGGGMTSFDVTCNQDLPFTIEVDNQAGGRFTMVDPVTAKTVSGDMLIDYVNDGTPNWSVIGTAANGEALAQVGIGQPQGYTLDIFYNEGYVPAVGTYLYTPTYSITW